LYSYYRGLNQYRVPTPFYDARNGPPNFLMHNNGDGTFSDVTAASGMKQNNDRYSFTCGWTDYNNDGWPDLYVVNDFGRKNLYRNNGDGTFTDVAAEAGVDDVGAGMSVCWLDYDNDGNQDLYVADMWSAAGKRVTVQSEFMKGAPAETRALGCKHARGNSLFRNLNGRHFEDVSAKSGVEMGRWSWSSDAWDFDHDGYPDLYISNGMISGADRHELSSFFWRHVVAETPVETAPAHTYEQGWNAINELIRSDGTWAGYERNTFYANNRDGTFSDLSGTAGLDFIEDSRSFALADFDHDGRLEIVLKNRNSPQVRVLKNVMRGIGSSLVFRLHGTSGNRDAIGAAITVEAGKLRQVKFLQAGSGFLSQHAKEVFFGLGDEKGPVNVTIRWPNGQIQRHPNVPVQQRIFIEEGSADFRAEPFLAAAPGSLGRPSGNLPPSNDLPANFESWLLAPVAAPDFSLPDVMGQTHTVASLRGQPLLLNFWATGSAGSEQQLKLFDSWRTGGAQPGPKVLAVNVEGPDQADGVRAFTRARRVLTSVLLASEEAAAIYNILYRYLFDRRRDLDLPTSFLVDERGFIVKVYRGCVDPGHLTADCRHIPLTAAARLDRGFPFPGKWYGGEFLRNQFTYAAVFFERGYLDAALASCRLLLENEPTSGEAYYMLGTIYLKKQLPEKARENLEQALKLKPAYFDTWPDAWNNLGMLAIQAGENGQAIQDFKQAIRLNPNHSIALQNLGNAYRQQGQWLEAQSTLERAVKIDPDDANANYSLAMVFAHRDDTEDAYEYLERALKLRPDYPDALNNLGILYARTGRLSDALATFEKCIEAAPDFDQGYLNLARAYVAKGDSEKARSVLRALLKRHPGHALAQKALDELGP
jgi:tetratricopeptide (TPR) repeat protein